MDTFDTRQAMRESLANEIRARRAYKRMSQGDLVSASGLSRSTIGRIENAERDMDIPQLVAIAAALETAPAELLQAASDAVAQ
ncbi:helix-turn-helix transcriptional regulator [Rhodococcus sp. PD04]|uniref:helix-turn-helix transcriptional regulator n=1 Tax=Rhodococcus sp. PD04 TaxID=3109594 RepID=UPI002DD83142|nr:helix-turn-helix transcriptional regulator [Rhodococcus sp. PD04]WSE22358.1 helix-turn-helix transcriptional regulator [Rhodococcus sp. PD04]